jgi:hypothetical protein
LGVLVYGYATGVFSSRKLERMTHVLAVERHAELGGEHR